MNRRGVSPVVATVLLIVLTVGIAALIFSFVIPFVNDQLGNSKECLALLDSVEFADSKFNCYKEYGVGILPQFETGFSIKIKKPGVDGVRVSLIDSNGDSEVKDFPDSTSDTRFRTIGSLYDGGPLTNFPGSGGQRTYITNTKYDTAEIAPIGESGEICAVSDTLEFIQCDDDVVFS